MLSLPTVDSFPPMIENLYRIYQKHPVITTDSRNIPPRSIFFALKGENFNGNRFADDALKLGAAYAVVDELTHGKDDRYLLTDDVLTTLQELANYHRKQLSIPIIAITGSNGKTTTKELIHATLSQKYRTQSTTGNLNNHIGVPLTLLSIRKDTEIAVVEMGANHIGEIDLLCELAEPTHGLITNIGKAHLEGFGSLEGVIQAKTELYDFLKKRDGTIFINIDDPLLMTHGIGLTKETYGFDPGADLSGQVIPGTDSLKMELLFKHERSEIVSSNLFGRYNASNILAAASVGAYFQVPVEMISSAMNNYVPENSRSQVKKSDRNLLILDAYNANPSSMTLALNEFSETYGSKSVVVLGDMLELGSSANEEHKQILELLEKLDFSNVILVGPIFSQLNTTKGWRCFETSQQATEWLVSNRIEGKTILLKGSRGIHLEEVLEWL